MSPSLVVVAGKGGVGRSTTAAALATNAADRGLKVLAIDAVGDGGLRAVLDSEGAAISDEVWSHLDVLKLTPDEALKEYLRLFLRVPLATSRIGPLARIFDYVATAAPGVREILVLGKIATEVRDGDWDLVVVDGPATGHAVELLGAADTLSELIRVGPIVTQTRWIGDLIADPAITTVLAVTLAEELPTTECLELLDRLRTEVRVDVSGVVVNRAPTLLEPDDYRQAESLGTTHAVVAAERSRAANLQLDRLESIDQPLLLVPPARVGVSALTQLRSALEDWF